MKRLDKTKWSETEMRHRDVLGRDWDQIGDAQVRDRDETETTRWYVSRPRRRDRDHIPGGIIYVIIYNVT